MEKTVVREEGSQEKETETQDKRQEKKDLNFPG